MQKKKKIQVLPLLQSHNSNHSATGLKLLNTLLHPIRTSLLPLLRSSIENCGNWVWKRLTADSLLPQAWWVWIQTATIIELTIFPLCSQMLSSSMEKLFFEAQGWVVVINCFSTSKFGVSELHRIWIWHRWRKNLGRK